MTFDDILPVVHVFSEKKHLHIESSDCRCEPKRFISLNKPYQVVYIHQYLWEPRQVVFPFPIVPLNPRMRSKGEDYPDEKQNDYIKDIYDTIKNEEVGRRIVLGFEMLEKYDRS